MRVVAKIYTREEAYRVLGLRPLDDYIRTAVALNDQRLRMQTNHAQHSHVGAVPERFRRIGATTWMLVEAVIQLKSQGQIWLEAPNTQRLNVLRGAFMTRLTALYQGCVTSTKQGEIHTEFGIVRLRTFLSSRANPMGARFDAGVFSDQEWAWKARDRFLGPFALIRTIRRRGTVFDCFDEAGDLMFSISEQGLRDLSPWDDPKIHLDLDLFTPQKISANATRDLVAVEDLRLVLMVADKVIDDLSWSQRGGSQDGWNDDPLSGVVGKPTPDKHPSRWPVKQALIRIQEWQGSQATVYFHPEDAAQHADALDRARLASAGLNLVVSVAVDRGKVYIIPHTSPLQGSMPV